MILGFKKNFEPLILEEKKIHTIREDKLNRWTKGNTIHFATGIRTKEYRCFKKGEVKGIQYVFMSFTCGVFQVSIKNDINKITPAISSDELHLLAKNDGFESIEDFAKWFMPLINSNRFKCYSAKLIHWTDFRY